MKKILKQNGKTKKQLWKEGGDTGLKEKKRLEPPRQQETTTEKPLELTKPKSADKLE